MTLGTASRTASSAASISASGALTMLARLPVVPCVRWKAAADAISVGSAESVA